MTRRAVAALSVGLAVGLAVVAGACTQRERPADVSSLRPLPSPATSYVIPSPVLSPRPFTSEDLARIVLGRGEAPEGTEFASPYSVDQSLEEFASDDEELGALRLDGFVTGHVTLYVPRGQLDHDAPPVEPGQVFVQGIAGLFETTAGADSSMRRYIVDLRAFQLRDDVIIPADGLGDLSTGLRGRAGGELVTVFVWRTANLLLVVSGAGRIDPRDVRSLADLTDRRADLAR